MAKHIWMNGQIVRKPSTLNKERVETDPAFAGARVASKAFKQGSIYAGVIRRAFLEGLLKNNSDRRVTSRLSGKMMKIIMLDKAGYPDNQKLLPGNLSQLVGLECNKAVSFASTMPAQVTITGDRKAGEWKALLPAIETDSIKAPEGAAFFKITVGVGAMQFEELKGTAEIQATEWIPLKDHKEAQKEMNFRLADAGNLPVIGMAAVSFAGERTGEDYPLFDKNFNAGVVVSVDEVVSLI